MDFSATAADFNCVICEAFGPAEIVIALEFSERVSAFSCSGDGGIFVSVGGKTSG